MPLTLALDQGTTSSRTIVFDEAGKQRAVGQQEFKQHFPEAGLVEHDAKEIWASQVATAVQALSRAALRPKDIAALGITNQRETTVLWDRKTGAPLHRAIVWQDRRTASVCSKLRTLKTDSNPLVLKTKMQPAGHGGASGRYDALRDRAFELAWMLKQVGITK